MLNNRKFLKIGSYLGLLSIISSNAVMAIPPKVGELCMHAHKELRIVGAPPMHSVVEDINQVSYEDFDVTANCPRSLMSGFGNYVFPDEKKKVRRWHLDTNIPYIGGSNPKVDYAALRGIPMFLALHLDRKLHPMDRARALRLFEKVIVKNHQNLSSDIQEIPNMDCLYYKNVGGAQHLFLRLSSETRKRAEIFNKESNGKTIYVEQGNARLISDGNATLDHAEIKADNIDVEAENKLLNRASQMEANDTINLKAREQSHETIFNKWVSEYKEKHKFAHAEGIHSIDYCTFNAKKVIQEGHKADNIGIIVKAEEFEDRAAHTTNIPAKVTLHNYAWAEDSNWCSHAEAWVDRLDDYLEPTRYFVKKFLSKSDVKGSSAKFGYTLVSADSEIDVLKDIKEDVVVHERHEMRSHEEKSGLSFCGGVKVPDPTSALKKAEQAYRADNMMGFTTSAISAAAKGIRTYQDYKQVQKIMNTPGDLNFAQTIELLKVLSHFVNGPSIQIGSRSIDVEQSQDISHGNLFTAPKMVFHNKERSTFAVKFVGDDIDIKTKTFVTFDLPQVFHSKMSMHQSGISVDLLTLALACCGGAGLMAAALTATTVNVSSQDNEQHVEVYEPTVIHANKLNIEAETGELTQAQIKAGIVHAIFTKDLSLKSLANIKWSKNSGGGIGFSLGGFADFKSLAESLVETVASSSRSHVDSGSFEKKIDEFASMVGEEEFYLKVGNVLKTESAFIGHILHDPNKEHIEAAKRINTEVEQQKYSWDNSFDLSIRDLTDTIGAIKQTVFDNAIEEGATREEAQKIADQKSNQIEKDIAKEQSKIEKTVEKVIEIDEKVDAKVKTKGSNKEKESFTLAMQSIHR